MAKKSLLLRAILRGEDQLSRPWSVALKRAERQAGRSFSRIERMGLRARRGLMRGGVALGRSFEATGRAGRRTVDTMGTLAKATGATAGIAALAVDRFGKFELEVARLGNVIGDGVDPVREYERTLRDMSIQFATDPIETARAAYMAFSGGVGTTKKELETFLPVALKAAKAGFAEPAIVVDALTSALNVFGKEGLTAAQAANKLFVAEALGKTDFGQIASSMGQVAGFAKSMGLSFEEILAPMTSITKEGVTTNAAFTQLRAVISGIVKPTTSARKALKKFKIPIGPEAVKQAGGLVGLMEKIGDVARRDPGAIVKMFGRAEAIAGVTRIAKGGFGDMEKALGALKNTTNEADQNFENLEKRTGFRIQQMKTGFSLLVTELGGGIAEGLGLDKMDTIPDRVRNAGADIRKGAKGFATGFAEALTGGQKLEKINWQQFATDAGTAMGNVVSALGKVATAIANGINLISKWGSAIQDFWADEGVQKVEKRLQVEDISESGQSEGLGMDVLAGIAPGMFGGRQRAVERSVSGMREMAGSRAFSLMDPLTLMAEAEKRKARHDVGRQAARSPATAKLGGLTAGAVGGVIESKHEITIKGPGELTKTETKAKPLNPAVPIKTAPVGKRKAGAG